MIPWEITDPDLPPPLSDRFVHILSAVDTIDEWLQGLSRQQLFDDRRLQLALERLLEIVSVATDHIPAHIKKTEVAVDWPYLVDVGRRLENAHDRIEPEVLWNVARYKLTPLKKFVQRCVEA
jgi:uncharacterized protein with HEPN domain